MEKSRVTVVVVDDDSTNLIVARSNLTEKYNVVTVPSGKKLFSLLEKITPDIILLDIEMPEMDGYVVIALLKSCEKTACIPVIFLSAHADNETMEKGFSLGAADYATKPFEREKLMGQIELHLKRRID
jgi:putative two-component system response regulator